MNMTQMLQDYYAAMAWLYHDFVNNDDESLSYFRRLEETFNWLVPDDHDVDDLDMAWSHAEKCGDFSAFNNVVARLVKGVV